MRPTCGAIGIMDVGKLDIGGSPEAEYRYSF